MDHIELAVLPGADTQQEAHHIRLLVSPNLLHVLVCTHDERLGSKGIQQVNQTGWYEKIQGSSQKERAKEGITRYFGQTDKLPITEDVHYYRWSMASMFIIE